MNELESLGQNATKQRILDAAESLFARKGFHNTSLRAITTEAKVNLAAVNYHFGSKEGLLEAVFGRRLLPLNKIRRENLEAVRDAAQREGRRADVEEVLRAFIEPTLAWRRPGTGTEDFIALVGRAISEPDGTVLRIFMRHMEALFLFLFETLQDALPDFPQDILFWRLQFVLGAMSHTMRMSGKLRDLLNGVAPEIDTDSLTKVLLQFVTRGMEAP